MWSRLETWCMLPSARDHTLLAFVSPSLNHARHVYFDLEVKPHPLSETGLRRAKAVFRFQAPGYSAADRCRETRRNLQSIMRRPIEAGLLCSA